MTDLRKAVHQALEALEPYADIKPRDWKTDREKLWRAYDALRAALAQPDVPDVDVVKHATNRFLVWRLPEHFSPDSFISFDREKHNTWGGYPNSWPTGTNLFTYEQAKEMFAYCLDGFPKVPGGYVLVPVEPTEEMAYAGARSIIEGREKRPGVSWAEEAQMAYAAMLAAAPKGGV